MLHIYSGVPSEIYNNPTWRGWLCREYILMQIISNITIEHEP